MDPAHLAPNMQGTKKGRSLQRHSMISGREIARPSAHRLRYFNADGLVSKGSPLPSPTPGPSPSATAPDPEQDPNPDP